MVFHCPYNAELPAALNEPVARLPRRKWPPITPDGEACEMEDAEEKSVFVLKNENVPTEITAVVARYSSRDVYLRTSLTCNFVTNTSGNLDLGDFSQKHLRSAGFNWHERLTDFD